MITKLFLAAVKMQFRDRLGLFWAFAFPAMFIIIFGLFNFDRQSTSRLAIIDEARTRESQFLKHVFSNISYFHIEPQYTTEAEARAAVQKGRLDYAIVIQPRPALDGPLALYEIQFTYDEKNKIKNEIVRGVLTQLLSQANVQQVLQAQSLRVPETYALKEDPLVARRISYMDFLLPGILGMALMTMSIIGIAVDISRYREQRILKRILATPLPPRLFVISMVFAYLVLIVVQVTILVALGHFLFNAKIYGSLAGIYGLALLGALVFLGIGFIVAAFSKSPNHASSLGNIISMPMMFLSGVFFPVDSLPPLVHSVVQFLPLTPLMQALRDVSFGTVTWASLGLPLGLVLAWLALVGLIATKTFKFAQD